MPAIVTLTLNPAVDIYTSVAKLAPTHKLRCTQERRDPGGGGINVARVVTRLGGDVEAVFPAGGPVGDFLQRLVRDEGLVARVVPIAGVTRESFTALQESSGDEFRFVLPGPFISEKDFDACLAAVSAAKARYVVASGSLPPDAPADAYARLAARAKQDGAKCVVDASGEAPRRALDAGVHLIKPNLHELCALTNETLESEAEIVAAAEGLVRSGKAEIIAVSRSAQGALLVTRDGVWKDEAIEAPIVSSVGAGDCFLAGLLWSSMRGDEHAAALGYSLAAGAASLLQPGTTLCTKADVERLAARAVVRRL